ncbi:EAL domain-containing protein [Shinella pollutisoli]|uniref:EAL domain-containing protein n=1 Tax=Shinella pollutisoli TaxID=2250594 RepID=A0ABV7DP95_9HYPH|nr:EAL domain-containing protein [Shinella pollutisoli]
MMTVLGCVYNDHNLFMVVLAVLVCVLGSAVTLRLLRRGVRATGMQRFGWQFLAAVAGGGGVWATHFVGILAYRPSAPVSFDPVMTAFSLLIAIAGALAAFFLSGMRGGGRLFPALGGAFAGLSFSAMHYTGMMAYRVVGIVEWRVGYVAASVLFVMLCTAAAIGLVWRRHLGMRGFWTAVALLVAGIAGLHFTGMTALRIVPLLQEMPEHEVPAFLALAMTVAVVALIIIGTGLTSYLIDSNVRTGSQQQLRHLASHDTLTGLPNRAHFNEHLRDCLHDARQSQRQFAVVGIDLNRFKEINDTLGHATGDEALRIVARRMAQCLEDGEFLGRLGGDEFSGIKPCRTRDEALAFAERLAGVLARPMRLGTMEMTVGASIGVAMWPEDGRSLDELVNNADIAMYHAKHASLDTICFYDAGIGAAVRKRRQLADALRVALEHDELAVHYQVQKSLATGEISGYEALLRWTHPQLGPIPPVEFIQVAEENGLIAALGAWVLRRACRDAATWPPSYRIAVNVSAVQLMDVNLPQVVHSALVETGLPAHRLELELTETALVKDKGRSLHVMRQIKALGVGIALDDFGSGYSSLDTLRSFPFDKIKLDRTFVEGIGQDRQSKAIVRAVLALGKSLDIPILAEGIETDQQRAILQEEGCDEGQGFLLGRPSPLTALDGKARSDAA